MTKRTNYFGRFKNKSADAEDRLTRAFFVLFRLIPPVQATFVEAIREEQQQKHDQMIPSRMATEKGVSGVWSQTRDLHADEGRVLSILLNKEEWDEEVNVQASDRTPVYDGVVHYGQQWVFAIENKPSGNVQEYQLHPSIEEGKGLEVDGQPVVLIWKDLIRRLHTLVESDWLDYTQRRLVVDFLRYAQDEFPEINPYPTLEHCRDDLEKLNRRCEALMQELAPDRVETHRDWRNYIEASELEAAKMVSVSAQEKVESWEIDLVIHPGDTVSQAKVLYSNLDVDALLALIDKWDCSTNLHFSYISTNLVYPDPEVSFGRYVEFWRKHRDWIRKVQEEEFEALLNLLADHGLIAESGIEEFEEEFVDSGRDFVYVCPGISLHYLWSRSDALELDREDRLQTEIDERVREAVRTWGAETGWDSVRNDDGE